MGLLEQGNTSGPFLLESGRTIHPHFHPLLVHVLTVLQHYPVSLPSWEMTTFVRVETPPQEKATRSLQMTHSGMVKVVELPPAVS